MATLPTLIAQSDLEERFTALTVQRFADDVTGAGIAANVATALGEASDVLRSILGPAYSEEQVVALVADDRAVRGAACDIAMALLARRRAEFRNADGSTPYATERRDAERTLERIAKRERRPGGEASAGANQTAIGVDTNRPATALIFQGSRDNPRGPGGF